MTALEKLGSEQAGELRARVIRRGRAQRGARPGAAPEQEVGRHPGSLGRGRGRRARQRGVSGGHDKTPDKQKAYHELNAFSLENQVAELDELAERYPADLEVRLRLIDTLVKHIGALRKLDEIESNVFRAQALIAQAEGMASESDTAWRMQIKLAAQTKTLQTALEIAERKNEVEQQLRSDRLLDSWKRAKVQVDELLKDYPTRRDLVVWSWDVRGEALRGALERLKEKTTAGVDVWDKAQPAAQVLILNEDNMEARQANRGRRTRRRPSLI